MNFTRGVPERFQHLQVMQGKSGVAVPELHAGDVGAVTKLRDTLTGVQRGTFADTHGWMARLS